MQGEQFIEVCKQKIKKYTDILQKLKQELASLLEGISGCNSKTLGAA
jgi:prefoldin subunit 5